MTGEKDNKIKASFQACCDMNTLPLVCRISNCARDAECLCVFACRCCASGSPNSITHLSTISTGNLRWSARYCKGISDFFISRCEISIVCYPFSRELGSGCCEATATQETSGPTTSERLP